MSLNDGLTRAKAPRVVHVTTSHTADDVRIFERECRSLASSGRYDVYLAAAGAIPSDAGVVLIPLKPTPASRLGRFTAGPRKALALARSLSADLWHFHDPELLPVAYQLARSGQRVVWDAHEDYQAQLSERGSKDWIPGFARGAVHAGTTALLGAVDRRAAGVVAATPTIARRYSNPRTVVVGNEARLELFSGCSPRFGSRQVLFTGTVGAGHLFREVVEAVSQLPDVSLMVAGRDPDPAVWSGATGVLGERLRHAGWLDRQGIAAAISDSAVGLCTYARMPTNDENSPNKLFEFGAAGLPVVASPTASNVRYLGESRAGVLADDFTATALADAIRASLSDLVAWQAASVAGRRWAATNGSWARSEKRLLSLYDAVLSGRSTRPMSAGPR
jgi:glycosyltransferase involved in cell wall biosynthesis